MKVEWNKVKIIKKAGSGMVGTTYKVEYKGKIYAQKIQRLFEHSIKPDFEHSIWREIDFYNFISKLSKSDKKFFMKMYDYDIYNNCKHVQIRKKKPFSEKHEKIFEDLDKSDWCIRFLIEYKGTKQLSKYITKLTTTQIYSILLQLCKICYIVYNHGYWHHDLHPSNIMLKKTTDNTFKLLGYDIPYNGYKISIVDYGNILNDKFAPQYKKLPNMFVRHKLKWMYTELQRAFWNIVTNYEKYLDNCNKKNVVYPWFTHDYFRLNGLINIIKNDIDFINKVKHKYYKISSSFKLALENLISDPDNEEYKKSTRSSPYHLHHTAFVGIITEFQLMEPEKYMKYFEWCSYHKMNLPAKDIKELLLSMSVVDMIKYCINKAKN